MSFTFTRYDSNNKNMTPELLSEVKRLLIDTAREHHKRDLNDENDTPYSDDYLIRLIHNNRTADQDDPDGHNWMKVEYGENDKTHPVFKDKGDIVIIYRLMQHRIRLVGRMQWSLTVGFDQMLLTAPDGSDQTESVYLQFADILAGQIRRFCDDNGRQPIDFIMIDDKPPEGSPPSRSKVQKLFEIAETYHDQHGTYPNLYSKWEHRLEHIPHSQEGVRYYGYKKTDSDMAVTTITLLPPHNDKR